MELQTVTAVSRALDISTRMLRYYEQAGLIESCRRPGYAYRLYDEANLRRLRQVLLLRKLRIPVRQIRRILEDPGGAAAIEVFSQSIAGLDSEMDVLAAIRAILARFVQRLQATAGLPVHPDMLDDDELLALAALPAPDNLIREDKAMDTMDEMKRDMQTVNAGAPKLNDVRIVYLPPSAVAASHYVGDDPELHAGNAMRKFVLESGLVSRKPDLRSYGFNHPNPVDETNAHGYEIWITIPDDMAVPAPLEKKQFPGGLYAAHVIAMGNFHEWDWLAKWVMENDTYEYAGAWQGETMFGWLEEHLNYINHVHLDNPEPEGMQLDLLIPVREKAAGGAGENTKK